MSFMNWIVEELNDVSDFLYTIFLEVYSWVAPFRYAAEPFYSLCQIFNWLAWDFYDFSLWVNDVASKLTTFLSSYDLERWFKDWKAKILDAWDWVRYAWSNVTGIIDDWWLSTRRTVQGWIAIATQGLSTLIAAWSDFRNITWPQWTGKLDSLTAAWDNFRSVTFPTLVSFNWLTTWWTARVKDVQGLIDSAFTIREGLWSGWQDWRDKVTEFFTDPEDWLYKSLDRIIERFW